MGLVSVLILVAVLIYALFWVSVFVLNEKYPFLVELSWYASVPAFWLGYPCLICIILLFDKLYDWGLFKPGASSRWQPHLAFFVFGTPIGWGILIGGTWMVQYLIGNYDIVPTQ